MEFFTPEQAEKLSKGTVRCDFLVKLEFVSETVYLWNGHYPLTVAGQVYTPLHGIAVIDGLGVTSNAQSQQITFSVSGIPNQEPDLLALALEETSEANQQSVSVYMQLFDEDWQPEGSPVLIWVGFLQPPRVERTAMTEDEGSIQTIHISAENAFYNRARPAYGRYTDRDQQRRFPGDKFFRFTALLQQKTFVYPDY